MIFNIINIKISMIEKLKEKNDYTNALRKAIKIAGSRNKLIELCNYSFSYHALSQWLYRNKKVSVVQTIRIEKALNKKITRQELRPDIYPPE